jgi:hypothetical protein
MTEVDLVVAALAAGATAGLTASASSAVQDLYGALREAVRKRFAAGGEASVLDDVESEGWRGRLGELVSAAGADRDEEILAMARALLQEIGATDSSGSTNVVDARGAQGVQVGDRNRQNNTFG